MGVEVKVELRWADMDAYRHVNNVAMFRLIEEARIRFLADKLMGVESGRITMFVAHQEIDYVQPLLYSHEPARVVMRATRIGTAGFGIGYEIIADQPRPDSRALACRAGWFAGRASSLPSPPRRGGGKPVAARALPALASGVGC